MRKVIRFCTLCDQPYQAGTFREHSATHTPIRRRSLPKRSSERRDRALVLLGQGMRYAEIARTVGLSRQRIYQIAKEAA